MMKKSFTESSDTSIGTQKDETESNKCNTQILNSKSKSKTKQLRIRLRQKKKHTQLNDANSSDNRPLDISTNPISKSFEQTGLVSSEASDSSEMSQCNSDTYKPIPASQSSSLSSHQNDSNKLDTFPFMHSISWSYQLEQDPDYDVEGNEIYKEDVSENRTLERKKKKSESVKARFDDPSTWLEAMILASRKERMTMVGFGVVVAGTVMINPLIFLGGAVWAVGVLSTMENGFSFFSNTSFSNLFWTEPSDSDSQTSLSPMSPKSLHPLFMEQIEVVRNPTVDLSQNGIESFSIGSNNEMNEEKKQKKYASSPESITTTPNTKEIKPKELECFTFSEQNFPTLQHNIISGTAFDGLKATDCFEVFFDDDAPFSFQQFQEKLGDINIEYEKWKDTTNSPVVSFHPSATTPSDSLTKQLTRTTTFQTLTKSYFGPAYAQAKKIQVATFFSDALVILENKTILSGIPFSDKFFVLERWILQTQDEDTSKLNASVQVCMLINSCPFESQIRKKSVQGCTEMVTLWTRSATEALEITKQKRKQQKEQSSRLEHEDKKDEHAARSDHTPSKPSTEDVLHMQMTKLKELENLIAAAKLNGTLEHIQVFDDSKLLSNSVINTTDGIEVLQLILRPVEEESEDCTSVTSNLSNQPSKEEIQETQVDKKKRIKPIKILKRVARRLQ